MVAHSTTKPTPMRFMVRYDADSIESLEQIGRVAFRSGLVNWLALEADETDAQRIAQVPGVLEVYPEREIVWCGDGSWMTRETHQYKLKAMRELLPEAEASLARLHEQLGGKPELLSIYEPSARELIRRVKAEIEWLEGLEGQESEWPGREQQCSGSA
ncbi:MAG: hypothetical protein VB144_11600 [Clostridia bacterium]|nr:hypothetical protein [Clostridia bacterium]